VSATRVAKGSCERMGELVCLVCWTLRGKVRTPIPIKSLRSQLISDLICCKRNKQQTHTMHTRCPFEPLGARQAVMQTVVVSTISMAYMVSVGERRRTR
jgi:hypothetical protein